ncbi:MAG: sodium-dependent transporter [Cyclobacteriaceae bacterium]|nr:sodium-dependent transporter [Cyclobacteriaceae bacterium]
MSDNSKTWSSHYLFILASIGSTVGLSNIWKFTYLAGENGGGAFVMVYLISLLVMGIPILGAELMIGRRGGRSMVGTLEVLSRREGLNPHWRWFGWVAMIGVFLILSFYCVVAGMTLDYTVTSLLGMLNHLDKAKAVATYEDMLSNPWRLMLTQGIFVAANIWIVAKGVREGLERSISWMTPGLFIILVALVIYAMFTGAFAEGLRFLFTPDFSRITPHVILAAFGQAFFSLGIGVGVMLTYGAYMPKSSSILKSAAVISFSDGFASMLAGLAIFPIVFQYGLSPTEGPGLIFMTLPIAFDQMPGGSFIGAFFFLLLLFAALTSSISLLESIIAHLEETTSFGRKRITIVSGILLWVVGLGTVFSFNISKDVAPLNFVPLLGGKNFFELIDFFGSNLLMPVGGILMAVIAGWLIPVSSSRDELQTGDRHYLIWQILIRYIAPLTVLGIFISNLTGF